MSSSWDKKTLWKNPELCGKTAVLNDQCGKTYWPRNGLISSFF
jgi:hypothetical protein